VRSTSTTASISRSSCTAPGSGRRRTGRSLTPCSFSHTVEPPHTKRDTARIIDERELAELDPYDLLDQEAARLERFYSSLDEARWEAPSRCSGWSVRDVLAHLLSAEEYHHAGLEGTVDKFLRRGADAGATDLDSFNEWTLRALDGTPSTELLERWCDASAKTRRGMRERNGTEMATSVGEYPVRRQAFYVASELATHADDVGAPVAPDEAAARTDWRARHSRSAIAEADRGVEITARDGRNHVKAGDELADLRDEELVDAAEGRLPAGYPLPAGLRQALNLE
jgi:uncharacterized protein (TIGR03083 family)